MRGKGEGSIYKDSRGLWTAVVELPQHDGSRRRKAIRSKSKATVLAKLRAAQHQLAESGDLPTRDVTLAQWIDEWFSAIAQLKVRPKTAHTYRGLIDREILPSIGSIKLDKLTTTDVRRMLATVTGQHGLSSSTAAQVHRILSVALKYAVREGKITRNVAALTDAPRRAATNLAALNVDEGFTVIQAGAAFPPYAFDPLGSLWAAVVLTGARQGELLGLECDRVTDTITLSWQLQRLTWEHGCNPPCGRKRGADCRLRKVTFPADHEHRHLQGGLWLSRPKTSTSWRVIPLVEPLRTILATHLAATRDRPNPHGLVWTMPNGDPIDPRVESEAWHEMLTRLHLTDVRLHDGRHTTVDLLYEAGVPEDLIQEIVGHSTRTMTRAYKTRGNSARLVAAMEMFSAQFNLLGGARSGIPALGASTPRALERDGGRREPTS